MKKTVIVVLLLLFCVMAGCQSDAGGEAVQTPEPAAQGEMFETEDFSVTVPDGWEHMDIDGGVQLYKMSGEVFEVHFRGLNQGEDHAKQQVEWLAEQYDGTPPEEVDLLGKRFWSTAFTASGVPQITNLCIEDGVMISVKYGGPDYTTNADFTAILDSIVFK